ncbi:MAG: Hsp20 family protein [Mesorhizobium sp.]|uniref:Molecular chaperone Hsp20 n=1 Tax=Mesorhizobium mediterraneum TaxID=43617 RepID=A0AB36RHX6_9HYPH|nr:MULTISPECIES: Hsp20 family protein [Mesorhizobium]RUU46222.1 Hsp20 family protein [Mesorhizobium sp. M6A.T.Ca.TU.002.02.2.1]AZO67277.1 Hsp20 family protein [Mesorhizobium sp. M6A.T.Cr.TU.016.01.1.1]PAQ04161.1 molecular chaperone Hsp20 [Mesorhizobium mediterraneum]RUU98203.1 Hsp20 family protein [Mesorhizobium sp. M6A.T.Cr.TU.017.01.1.1]RWN28378.1 MAG: Hsp20 family protein [Mesorhizobium sp.]
MRTASDFSPLYRSSIGFDRIFDLLENAPQTDSWPPYDIERSDENSYRVTIAVAGFSEDDLDISHEPNLLIVSGERKEQDKVEYLHRGLPVRPFTRRFELADHMTVTGASLNNGLLTIDLVREVPEEMKPRRITITREDGAPKAGQVEKPKQAA